MNCLLLRESRDGSYEQHPASFASDTGPDVGTTCVVQDERGHQDGVRYVVSPVGQQAEERDPIARIRTAYLRLQEFPVVRFERISDFDTDGPVREDGALDEASIVRAFLAAGLIPMPVLAPAAVRIPVTDGGARLRKKVEGPRPRKPRQSIECPTAERFGPSAYGVAGFGPGCPISDGLRFLRNIRRWRSRPGSPYRVNRAGDEMSDRQELAYRRWEDNR